MSSVSSNDSNFSTSQIYLLKQQAMQHLQNRKYSYAMVYLLDTLAMFNSAIEEEKITDASQMQELVKQVKIPCHKNLSLCYLKQGNYENCIKQCEQVLKIQPNCAKILYRVGIAHLNLGDLQKADNHLRKAYFLQPNEKQVMKALERIQSERSKRKVNMSALEKGQSKSSTLTIITLIKLMIFWPFYLLQMIFRGIFFRNSQ